MILLIILTTVLAIFLVKQWRDIKALPKGPTPLPFIGNIHQLVYNVWKHQGIVGAYHVFEKQFGKVFTIWIGPYPTVYITDYDVAHETHVKNGNVFGSRLMMGGMNRIREGRGILASNGTFWQNHRRFALQTLRNFGLGRNIMETRIMDELNYRISDFEKLNSVNGNIETIGSSFFDLLVGSIINQLLISERFEQDDAEFEKLKISLAASMEKRSILDIFAPRFIMESKYMKWRQDELFEPFDWIFARCERNVNERLAKIKSGEHEIVGEGNDFIDAYLLKIEKDEKSGDSSSTFNYETLAIDLFDLWLAGQETTSTTLTWAAVCLLNHPEVAKKLRQELLAVTNGERNLSLTDRLETPYLNAVINEVQRISSILNINLFRVVSEDTTVGGQPIPANTAVTTQLSLIHTDEELFKNSTEFDPERFLRNEGLEKKMIPFGIGKRACLGESLARAELYLILGNLVLKYDFEPVGEIPKLITPTPYGVMKRPPAYKIRFVPVQ